MFNGAEPTIRIFASPDEETAAIAEWLRSRGQEGYTPHEMSVFVRSKGQLDRAIASVEAAGYTAVQLAQHAGGVSGNVAVGTMHLAKGQLLVTGGTGLRVPRRPSRRALTTADLWSHSDPGRNSVTLHARFELCGATPAYCRPVGFDRERKDASVSSAPVLPVMPKR